MHGTKFRIFPKPEEDWLEPETITLGLVAGSIGAGPSDAAMRTIRPVSKALPYDPPRYIPPYTGDCVAPAMPNVLGHFDHIAVDDPSFLSAHMYACARHTLETWEHYLGHRVRWWHAELRPQLELVSLVDWTNAQSGLGFVEAGGKLNDFGQMRLFALNFDVIAHEIGHTVLFSEIGVPASGAPSAQFMAFHESFSDLVSLIAVLQFPSVIHKLLRQTHGNLYALNMLSRIGELSRTEQIRIADNTTTMADVAGIRLTPAGDWIDLQGLERNAHGLAQPLTGAVFDILVEVFQDGLAIRGALPGRADARGWSRERVAGEMLSLHALSAQSLATAERDFYWALSRARDLVGIAMRDVIRGLRPENVTFDHVASRFVASAERHGQSHIASDLHKIFAVRGMDSRRVVINQGSNRWRAMTYAERVQQVSVASRGHAQGCRCRADHPGFLAASRAVRHAHGHREKNRLQIVSEAEPR